MISWKRTVLVVGIALASSGLVLNASPCAQGAVWFAKAEAIGNGKTAASPIGSSAELDSTTKPGDTIILLPSASPLDGGLTLKSGQTLMGVVEGGRKSSITNMNAVKNGGNGIVLANDTRVIDVSIKGTSASGIFGLNVSGVHLIGVDVEDANQAGGLTKSELSVLGRISHGGILFVANQPDAVAENSVQQCTVMRASGIGLGVVALNQGRGRLRVSQTRVEGGSLIAPLFDMGIAALADGKTSKIDLEMSDCIVRGRLSEQGRNVLVWASAQAKADARIDRSTMSEVGQDGVVAVAASVPATVEVEIRDSIIEKAGQMNIEGSILNLPPSDRARAHESLISIDVKDSIIREVGFVDGFRGEAQNIWLAPTVFVQGPFAKGRYRLSVVNSTIEKAIQTGIGIGNSGSEHKIPADESEYEVYLRNNTIRDNGASEFRIAASRARIDAKQNYWGAPAGLAEGRVVMLDGALRSQVDSSRPLIHEKARMPH